MSEIGKSGSPDSIITGIPLSEEPGLGTLTLPGFLREVTARFAEREALVMHLPDGVERWTYATVWERAFEVARALMACGVGKSSRVGILMTNRPEWIAAVFGTAIAGGVAVPLSTFSTAPELEYLLQASCVSILLFERAIARTDFTEILCELEPVIRISELGQLHSVKFPFLRRLAVVGTAPASGAIESWAGFLANAVETPSAVVAGALATVTPADPAVLIFSSGSTAKPKGVLSAHRGVAIQLWRWRRMFCLGEDVRSWTANGFFWSGNFGMVVGGTFGAGGAIVLQRTFDAEEALELMQAEKVTMPVAWPHQWARLEAASNWNSADLSCLRYVDKAWTLARHPTIAANWVEPRWAYGNTETFTITTGFQSDTPPERVGDSHGEALPGNTLKIVDPLTGATMPCGERGEIAVKGPTLMLGYIGVPLDETLDEQGFFRTGDGGYVDEQGRLFWEGRLNDIIKTGGANVSPLEIDAALIGYPGLKLSHTVGVPHETLGEMVVMCAVPHLGCALDEAAMRDFLKQRLASYKIPRRVLFFQEEDLSLTGSAKVKSGMLRELVVKRLAAEGQG
jgi:fatty-acyl-CoA synthase